MNESSRHRVCTWPDGGCGECDCPRSEHMRGRGICFTCYGRSNHGQLPYCNRWRKPARVERERAAGRATKAGGAP